jgi:hypothetical protein
MHIIVDHIIFVGRIIASVTHGLTNKLMIADYVLSSILWDFVPKIIWLQGISTLVLVVNLLG